MEEEEVQGVWVWMGKVGKSRWRDGKASGLKSEGQKDPCLTPVYSWPLVCNSLNFPIQEPQGWAWVDPQRIFPGHITLGQRVCLRSCLPFFQHTLLPSLLAMASRMQMAALPCLSLLLLWSQVLGAQDQKFQFGPCQVKGVVPQKLWEAFWAVKDTMQAQDNITSVRLLQEVLQNVSAAESCYLVHTLLEFYLKTVFKNYHNRTVEVRTLKSFSTLANNFVLIVSQLQPSLDMEAALTKALGEVDVLLTWMQKFYKF
ncbi:Interleukin-24 [Plecturocebus cupreus]